MLTETNQRSLLNNHLKFLKTHRGKVEQEGDTFLILSDRQAFHFAILGKQALLNDYSKRFNKVYLPPWSDISDNDLERLDFKQLNGLTYMALGADANEWKENKNVDVSIVRKGSEMEIFSEVQARGFADSEEDYVEWHPWLHAANLKNLDNSSQQFYVGRMNEQPAGVALFVLHENLGGLYAIATLTEFRKQGVSTTIMKQVVLDALEKGSRSITLQVVKDSYAESFYRKLGFVPAFYMRIYSRV